jgi:neutral trehalase
MDMATVANHKQELKKMKKLFVVGALVALLIAGGIVATGAQVSVQQTACNNLTEITGVFTYGSGIFSIDAVTLHLGPRWLMKIIQSPYDYDGDGMLETVFAELQGLVGATVTVTGHLHEDGSLSVFFINGLPYSW